MWDAHTSEGRWWVITNPTNLCSQALIKSMDVAPCPIWRRYALAAGVRRRFAPDQLRHAHAVEVAREGVQLPVIQRQLGDSYVSATGVYLQGIDTEEMIGTIRARRAPMMHVSAGLEL